MAPPNRTRPSFPHSQSLQSGSFHKPLILIHQRADRMKTHNIRKLTKLITFFAAKDGEALYSKQKQDQELTVAQIMNSFIIQFRLKLKKVGKTTRSFRYQIRSDQISHSVVSDSLQPHESQHARPPCPSPTPGVH